MYERTRIMAKYVMFRNICDDGFSGFLYEGVFDSFSDVSDYIDGLEADFRADGLDDIERREDCISARNDDDYEVTHWVMKVEDRPYAVLKTTADETGGIRVRVVGYADMVDEASGIVMQEYQREMSVSPSFYAGWDPEYSEVDCDHAEMSVETMDSVVNITIAVLKHHTFTCDYFEHLSSAAFA